MTIGSALNFIGRIQKDNSFRKKLYYHDSVEELLAFLADENLQFTEDDFADAIQKQRVNAQFEEVANEYSEIKQWWDMLIKNLPGGS